MVNWKEQMHSIKALTGLHVMVHQNVYGRCLALEEASMRSNVFSLPAGQRRELLLPKFLRRLARWAYVAAALHATFRFQDADPWDTRRVKPCSDLQI